MNLLDRTALIQKMNGVCVALAGKLWIQDYAHIFVPVSRGFSRCCIFCVSFHAFCFTSFKRLGLKCTTRGSGTFLFLVGMKRWVSWCFMLLLYPLPPTEKACDLLCSAWIASRWFGSPHPSDHSYTSRTGATALHQNRLWSYTCTHTMWILRIHKNKDMSICVGRVCTVHLCTLCETTNFNHIAMVLTYARFICPDVSMRISILYCQPIVLVMNPISLYLFNLI